MALIVPHEVLSVCKTLRDAGFQAWLVGGAVRDSIMGRTPSDWDIATNARPPDVMRFFEKVIPTGLQHGTVTVVLESGNAFEVTTFRADGRYEDGRRPDDVVFLDYIEEDLARRDFTMNAIAYDPWDGVFADPFGGRDDIAGEWIRCVGTPSARFLEDGLRVLRAARFSATLLFSVEESTKAAVSSALESSYRGVAMERVCTELSKMLLGRIPSVGLEFMLETGLLEATIPEMLPMVGCTQNRYHGYDVWNHTMAVLNATPPTLELRLAALFHDVAKPETKGEHPGTGDATFYNHEVVGAEKADRLLRRLRFSNELRQQVVHLIRYHLVRYEPGWAAAAIRRWVRKVGADNVAPLLALARADIAGKGPAAVSMKTSVLSELEARIANMTIDAPIAASTAALAIGGAEVMEALGIKPGKQVGEVLRELLEAVTENPEINTREALLERLASKKANEA